MFVLIAAAMAAAPIAPTGPWDVEADDNLCVLQRNYPSDKGQVTLAFQPLLDLDKMEWFVVTQDSSIYQKTGKATVTIEPSGQSFSMDYSSVSVLGKKLRFTRLSIDRDVFDKLHDGDTVSISAKPIDMTFMIGRPEAARSVLAECIVDLKKSWGVDPAPNPNIVTPLEGNPAKYFSADVYPKEAIYKGIYGRVIALLQIDTSGKVDKCRILSSAGQELNDGTCQVALKIKFTPAKDKDGRPLPSTYLLPVNWQMPG